MFFKLGRPGPSLLGKQGSAKYVSMSSVLKCEDIPVVKIKFLYEFSVCLLISLDYLSTLLNRILDMLMSHFNVVFQCLAHFYVTKEGRFFLRPAVDMRSISFQ